MNKRRQASQLSTLDLRTIPLLEDDADGAEGELRQSVTKEDKISSSGRRFDALGTLLKPVPARQERVAGEIVGTESDKPYVIGLTGGIASGKTSVAKRLETLGAVRIDCDALGHVAYEKVSGHSQPFFGQEKVARLAFIFVIGNLKDFSNSLRARTATLRSSPPLDRLSSTRKLPRSIESDWGPSSSPIHQN